MRDRPDWDEYFLKLATSVAERADCRRSKVGAVIVAPDHRVISTGYNGSPPGAASCLAGECPRGLMSADECPSGSDYRNCIALHAERNAILYATRERLDGATIYITRAPCDWCTELIRDSGILRVVCPEGSLNLHYVVPESISNVMAQCRDEAVPKTHQRQ